MAKKRPRLLNYLPDERDWNRIDKQWVCDVIYTLDTDYMEGVVKKAQKDRQQKLESQRNEVIEIRPEFSEAL